MNSPLAVITPLTRTKLGRLTNLSPLPHSTLMNCHHRSVITNAISARVFRCLKTVLHGALLITALAASIGAQAQSAPKLVSVRPADGATGVATNSTVVFVFDQDMDTLTAFPIASFPPALVGNFEFQPAGLSFIGTFETDNRTLTIQCLTALPFDTTISWKLNPPGGTIFKPLASTSGKPLATISGSFRTAANLAAGPMPKIVSVTPANGSRTSRRPVP